ncbi:MAG: AraC family transcriptional regulator [Rhodobacterales bacterium 34-62-10]|nr:MAG: AraC family transcriptional regulator [Rhodobacterales bacterium 34-62-10]
MQASPTKADLRGPGASGSAAAGVAGIRIGSIAQMGRGAAWRLEQLHSHDHHLLLWITRGQGRMILQGLRSGIGTHNAVFVPAGTLLALDLGKQGFGLAAHLPASRDPGEDLGLPDEPQHLRIRNVQAQAEMSSILDAMQREQTAQRPYADEGMRAQSMLLSVWLRRQMIDHADDGPRVPASHRLVQAYCALVARDYASPKLMGDYAAELGVTPTHLTRSCREASGLTAADILTQRSLYAARDMIETTDRPLQDIGQSLNFSSPAYFSRFVQHHTGQSPSTLRRNAQR